MATVFRVDHPKVMHEVVDDEVVVIHLDTGYYYNLDPVAGRIWRHLADGARSAEGVVAFVQRAYAGDPAAVESGVRRFLEQLRDEQLAVLEEGSDPQTESGTAPDGERPAFAAPTLEKFTDMESLLLLDPIHEVDEEEGWPKRK